MITNIQLHPSQQARLKEVDLEQLGKNVLSRFPYPIAVSYRNFLKAASGGDRMNVLTTFAYDVTTSIFQFLALVLASDYHENRATRSLKIYNAIADMSYRPGPGKWLEFLKMYPNYLKESNERSFTFGEIISFIEINVGGKKKPRLKIEENYGNAPGKQAGLLEFMVMFRNNLAHSKGQKANDITNQATSVVAVTNYLFSELSFLMQYRLVIKTEDTANPFYMMGDSLAALPELDIDENIFLQKESHGLKLFPLIISDRPVKSRPEDVFLLESVDNDRVFFSGNRIMSEKLKGRDEMANKVFDFLQNIYTEPEILNLAQTSWEQFRNRCKDYSQQVLSDYVINNKYNEAVYVLPESYKETISGFRKSGKQIVFLTDGQGAGKSAFCAHLTNEFISHGNTNEASLLIDARLLDELKEEQDIFLEFIKKKLGLQGELPEFFRKLQDLEDNPKITLIIDNMNEYFLKERDQSFLLEQLFDTVNRLTGLNNIQIVVIARTEYYVKSFEKYAQSFKDFVVEGTYMPGKTAATPLPGLEENETEKIWNNYQQKFTGYSPRTGWYDLNISVRKSCNNPLIMLFLLKRYDNEDLPENLSIEKIKKQYIRGILKKKELKKTLFDLVKKMHKEQRPYLLTESFTREEIARLFDTTKDKKTNLPRNHAYAGLVDMQILREERVDKDGRTGKKISVNNEMTQDVIILEYDRWTRKTSLIFSFAIIAGLSLIMLILLGYISGLSQSGFEKNQIANLAFLNQLELKQNNFDNLFISAVNEIYNSNYPLIFIHSLVFSVVRVVFAGIWIILIMVLLTTTLLEFYVGKKFEKQFSFFEIMHFREIAKRSATKFIKVALPGLFILFVFGLAVMIKGIEREVNPKTISAMVILCVLYLLVLMVLVARNNFLNIKREGSVYERFYLKSNYKSLLKVIVMLPLFLFLMSVMLVKSEDWSMKKIAGYNERYSTLLMQQINDLNNAAKPSDISRFQDILEVTLSKLDGEDQPLLLPKSIIDALHNREIDFLTDQIFSAVWIKDNIGAGKDLFMDYWIHLYSFVAALIVLLTAVIEIPSFLNRRLKKREIEFKIV